MICLCSLYVLPFITCSPVHSQLKSPSLGFIAQARYWRHPGMHLALGLTATGIQECDSGWYVAWCVISDIPYNSSVLISFFFSFLFQLLWAASRKNYQSTKMSKSPVKPWNACSTWCHFMLLHPKLWPFSPPGKMSSLGVDSSHYWLITRTWIGKANKT